MKRTTIFRAAFFLLTVLVGTLAAAADLAGSGNGGAGVPSIFLVDQGTDLFSRNIPEFNSLDPQYAEIQLSKNIALIEKLMTDSPADPSAALEGISRFARVESAGFSDLPRALKSLEKLAAAVESHGGQDPKRGKSGKDQANEARTLYGCLVSAARCAIEPGLLKTLRDKISKGISSMDASNPFSGLARALIAVSVPGTGDAEAIFKELLESRTSDPIFHYTLGNTFLTVGDDPRFKRLQMQAPRSFEICLILTSSDERLLNRVANIFVERLESFTREKKDPPLWLNEYAYKKLIQLDPENPISRNNLGYFYANLNIKLDEALEHCSKAVELDPDNPYFLDSLGWVHFRMGDLPKALEILTKARDLNSEIPEVRGHLANVLYSAGKHDEAVKELGELVRLEPENATARNNLGFLLADKNIDYATALEHCQEALRLKPDEPFYLDSLGWVYVKLGNYAGARETFERALALRPDVPDTLVHQAYLELATGAAGKALELLGRALRIQPGTENLLEYIGLAYAIQLFDRELASIPQPVDGKPVSPDQIRGRARILSAQANLFEERGLLPRALEKLRALKDLSPENRSLDEKIKTLSKRVAEMAGSTAPQASPAASPGDSPGQTESFMKFIPKDTIHFSEADKNLCLRGLSFLKKNVPAMELINLQPFIPLVPQSMVLCVFATDEVAHFGVTGVYLQEALEDAKKSLKTLVDLATILGGAKIHRANIEGPEAALPAEGTDMWTFKTMGREIWIAAGKGGIGVSTSQAYALSCASGRGSGSTIADDPRFRSVWKEAVIADHHAAAYFSGSFFKALHSSFPALTMLRDFDRLLKIEAFAETLRFKDADTLNEKYCLSATNAEAAKDIEAWFRELVAFAKPIQTSEGITTTLEAKVEGAMVHAAVTVEGFLKLKTVLGKHFEQNKGAIINLINSIRQRRSR